VTMLQGYQYGRPALVDPGKTFASEEEWLAWLEEQRVEAVRVRRAYYGGSQYSEENERCIAALASTYGHGVDDTEKAVARAMSLWTRRLPEHLRLHEYSTVIQEAVDYIAAQLAGSFSVEVEESTAADVIRNVLDSSPELAGTDDEDDLTAVNPMREAVKVGDCVVLQRWDVEDQTCWLEFWDSERVELRFVDGRQDRISKAIVVETQWRPDPQQEGRVVPIEVRRTWEVVQRAANQADRDLAIAAGAPVPQPEIRRECVETVTRAGNQDGQDEEILEVIPWGVPFLPWWPIRSNRDSLRSVRGDSLITEQAMKAADRYNAVEQVSWLIARYNSHSNLVVTGDNALVMQQKAEQISKDVADVLLFPAATNAFALSLPTDPQMIEHQRQVLLDSLYGTMGIARVDQTSLEGLGGITGYALEILTLKSRGTFKKVRSQLIRDWKRVLNMSLDCFCYWSVTPPENLLHPEGIIGLGADGETVVAKAPAYDRIDPKARFPKRAMTINIGTGDVVDEAAIRDDFVAKLISQEEALRLRGKTPDQITQILKEQAKAAEESARRQREAFGEVGTEGAGRFGAGNGGQLPNSQRPPSSAQAGSSTQTTNARGRAADAARAS
jgi:hypothetical protein